MPMATQMVFFDDVKIGGRTRTNCSVKGRVIKTWLQPGFGDNIHLLSFEVLMIDEHGTKMQASASNSIKAKFESLFVDDDVIVITNYSLGLNSSKYKLTDHKYKLTLTTKTNVKVVNDFNGGTLYGFNFQSFANITNKHVVIGEPIDVIGYVVSYGDPKSFTYNKEEKILIPTTLTDLEGDQIDCTLFGVYAEQFSTFVADHDMKMPIILTLQFARTKIWEDHVIVQNGYYGTRLLINAPIVEVEEFKQRMLDTNVVLPELIKIPAKQSQSTVTTPDDFLVDIERLPLAEIDNQTKVAWYTSLSTIEGFIDEHEWCYIACKKCTRKVFPIDPNTKVVGSIDQKLAIPFRCRKCYNYPPVYLRYKVIIMVADETGSSAFTLFERDVIDLVRHTAYDLKKKQVDDDDELPDELNALIGQRFLWRVSVTEYNLNNPGYKIYTAGKFTNDEDTIRKWCDLHGVEQETALSDKSVSVELPNSNISTEDVVSVTATNDATSSLTTVTFGTPQGKRHRDDQNLDAPSVESTSKNRRVLNRHKTNNP